VAVAIHGCDYALSVTTAVVRLAQSDVARGPGKSKDAKDVVADVKELLVAYETVLVIVERDVTQGGKAAVDRRFGEHKQYQSAIAKLSTTLGVIVMLSNSATMTAELIISASFRETDGALGENAISQRDVSYVSNVDLKPALDFLLTIPYINLPLGGRIITHFNSLEDISKSSADNLTVRVKSLSRKRAQDILNYLQRRYEEERSK